MFGSKMQTRVALVFEIWVTQVLRVVLDDALHEWEVIEEDGTAETPLYVNPSCCQLTLQVMASISLHIDGAEA